MEARKIPQVPVLQQPQVPLVPRLSNLETGQTIDLPTIEASVNLPSTRTADEAFLRIHDHLDRIQQQFSQLVQQPNFVGNSTVPLYDIKREPEHMSNASPLTRMPKLFPSQYTIVAPANGIGQLCSQYLLPQHFRDPKSRGNNGIYVSTRTSVVRDFATRPAYP